MDPDTFLVVGIALALIAFTVVMVWRLPKTE
jgi:hypothetical protein